MYHPGVIISWTHVPSTLTHEYSTLSVVGGRDSGSDIHSGIVESEVVVEVTVIVE